MKKIFCSTILLCFLSSYGQYGQSLFSKDQIIDKVLKHIKIDVECGDLTAIEELLNNIPTEYLVGYLPEEAV
jgi:hypothetical protein